MNGEVKTRTVYIGAGGEEYEHRFDAELSFRLIDMAAWLHRNTGFSEFDCRDIAYALQKNWAEFRALGDKIAQDAHQIQPTTADNAPDKTEET